MRIRAALATAIVVPVVTTLVAGGQAAQADPTRDLIGTLTGPPPIAADAAARITYYTSTDTAEKTAYVASTASVQTHVGTPFSLDIPDGWYRNGYANVLVTAQVGSRWTLWNAVAKQGQSTKFRIGGNPDLWIAAGSVAKATQQVASFAQPSADPACVYHQDEQDATRIGEMHLADLDGMVGRFVYSVQQDSDITTGFHVSGKAWDVSGEKHMSDSMNLSAGVKFSGGARRYINSHFIYRLRWVPQYTCDENQWMYSTFAYKGINDVFRGPNQPGSNPWGSCHRRESEFDGWRGTIARNGGSFSKQTGQGTSYGGVADVFGFRYGGKTGWTEHVRLDYHNNNRMKATYICGDGEDPGTAHTIYNNTW